MSNGNVEPLVRFLLEAFRLFSGVLPAATRGSWTRHDVLWDMAPWSVVSTKRVSATMQRRIRIELPLRLACTLQGFGIGDNYSRVGWVPV